MNFYFFIIFQLIFFQLVKCEKQKNFVDGSRFQSIQCRTDNSTAFLKYCNVKAVSRRFAVINVGVKFEKTVGKPFYVQMILSYRYGLIYREVINSKKLEWCEIMDGKSTHLFVTQTISQLKGIVPNLYHKCPYEGDVDVRNLTLDDSKAFQIFPQGFYLFSMYVFDGKENEFFGVNATLQVKSHIKESMG